MAPPTPAGEVYREYARPGCSPLGELSARSGD